MAQVIQMNVDNVRDKDTYAIIGAAMAVHAELGHGFLEAVYQEALEFEFRQQNIAYEREKRFRVHYKEKLLSAYYQVDFVCYGTVVVEVKALQKISGREEAQLINYLKSSGLKRGLLLNFGTSKLQYKRLVF